MPNVRRTGPLTLTSCLVLDRRLPTLSLEENPPTAPLAAERPTLMAAAGKHAADKAIREVAAGRPVIVHGGHEQDGETLATTHDVTLPQRRRQVNRAGAASV